MDILTKYFSEFTEKQIAQFSALQGLYEEWNQKINVISRKDISSLYERHILHSLSIAALFEFTPGMEIIDLGTGGGFPGLPLAIFFPEVNFHLVDSIGKKLKVIDAVADAIQLKNIKTTHSRIEDLGAAKVDFIVSRAVAPLRDLWFWSKPLLKSSTAIKSNMSPGLICLKGGDLKAEMKESGTRPKLIPIKELFSEEFFSDKFLLYLSKQ